MLTAKGWTLLCKPQRAGLMVRFPEPDIWDVGPEESPKPVPLGRKVRL